MKNFKIIYLLIIFLITHSFAITKKNFDFVVGVDGDFKAAMNKAAQANPSESNRFTLFFPDGEYNIGSLTGDANQMTTFSTSNVSFIGQSSDKTIIYNKAINEGISITATIQFKANGIYMQDMTLLNKAIYGNESNCGSACRYDALMTVGDKHIYKNVILLSGQDTYYTKLSGGKGRTYWEGGRIEGTVDFICGDGDVFFEGTKLVMRRSGGYLTASQNNTQWGYVFNNAIIETSNSSFNRTFYLGRSWGNAKTVFLNTIMKSEPTPEGWGKNMNSVPSVFGEYNSKNANGGNVDLSKRKTYFDGGKDGIGKTLKTVWNASDAANYTASNILKGSDNWAPYNLTKQVLAPKIIQEGVNITWLDDEDAMCWVIFVNGKYKSNIIKNSYNIGNIAAGSKITVRAANSMGGLSEISNEITIQDMNLTYFDIKTSSSIGGTILQDPEGEKVPEGSKITFIAKPSEGWKFTQWNGKNALDAGFSNEWTTMVNSDIELEASFEPIDKTTYEAESGTIYNAIVENKNTGFSGSAYINFNADESYVKIPVLTDKEGEYLLSMTYANGTSSSRSLAISTANQEPQNVIFSKTDSWTDWKDIDITVNLPKGISEITFKTINKNDGPNLDKIVIKSLFTEDFIDTSPASFKKLFEKNPMKFTLSTRVYLYNINGKLVRKSKEIPINLNDLKPGIYMMRIISPNLRMQKSIQIK